GWHPGRRNALLARRPLAGFCRYASLRRPPTGRPAPPDRPARTGRRGCRAAAKPVAPAAPLPLRAWQNPRDTAAQSREAAAFNALPHQRKKPMIEQDVVVTTKYGRMPTFAVCPDGPGQYPGIIFYMDAPGIREELRNMARRIAREGYFCLLPDMYYRLGTLRFDVARRDDTMAPVFLQA